MMKENKKVCPCCGTDNSEDTNFCHFCGSAITNNEDLMWWSYDNNLNDEDRFVIDRLISDGLNLKKAYNYLMGLKL